MGDRLRGAAGRYIPRIDEEQDLEEELYEDVEQHDEITDPSKTEATERVTGTEELQTPAVPRRIWGKSPEEDVTEVTVPPGQKPAGNAEKEEFEGKGGKQPRESQTNGRNTSAIPATVELDRTAGRGAEEEETRDEERQRRAREAAARRKRQIEEGDMSPEDRLLGKLKGGDEIYEEAADIAIGKMDVQQYMPGLGDESDIVVRSISGLIAWKKEALAEEVQAVKARVTSGGIGLREAVIMLSRALLLDHRLEPVIVSAMVVKILLLGATKPRARLIKNVILAAVNSVPEEVGEIEQMCEKYGYVERKLLDPGWTQDAEVFKGMTEAKWGVAEELWEIVLSASMNILCYEPARIKSRFEILEKYQVVDSKGGIKAGHPLLEVKGEKLGLLIGKHEEALHMARIELGRIGQLKYLPDEADQIENLMYAVSERKWNFVEKKMVRSGTDKRDITWETVVQLLAKYEEEDGRVGTIWGRKPGDQEIKGKAQQGSGSGKTIRPADNGTNGWNRHLSREKIWALNAYARIKKISSSGLDWEVVEADGGLEKWGKKERPGGKGKGSGSHGGAAKREPEIPVPKPKPKVFTLVEVRESAQRPARMLVLREARTHESEEYELREASQELGEALDGLRRRVQMEKRFDQWKRVTGSRAQRVAAQMRIVRAAAARRRANESKMYWSLEHWRQTKDDACLRTDMHEAAKAHHRKRRLAGVVMWWRFGGEQGLGHDSENDLEGTTAGNEGAAGAQTQAAGVNEGAAQSGAAEDDLASEGSDSGSHSSNSPRLGDRDSVRYCKCMEDLVYGGSHGCQREIADDEEGCGECADESGRVASFGEPCRGTCDCGECHHSEREMRLRAQGLNPVWEAMMQAQGDGITEFHWECADIADAFEHIPLDPGDESEGAGGETPAMSSEGRDENEGAGGRAPAKYDEDGWRVIVQSELEQQGQQGFGPNGTRLNTPDPQGYESDDDMGSPTEAWRCSCGGTHWMGGCHARVAQRGSACVDCRDQEGRVAQENEMCTGSCGCRGCAHSVDKFMEECCVAEEQERELEEEEPMSCSQRRDDECYVDRLPKPGRHRYHALVDRMEQQQKQDAAAGFALVHGVGPSKAAEMAEIALRWGGKELTEAWAGLTKTEEARWLNNKQQSSLSRLSKKVALRSGKAAVAVSAWRTHVISERIGDARAGDTSEVQVGKWTVRLACTEGKKRAKVTDFWDRADRMFPITWTGKRPQWHPEHRPRMELRDPVFVTAGGGGERYHLFEQCGSLQWGHAAVEASEAMARGCTECLQCRQQRRTRTWQEVPERPRVAGWEAAPNGTDLESGRVDWVDISVDTRILRWLCMARNMDSGGSDTLLVERLQDWDDEQAALQRVRIRWEAQQSLEAPAACTPQYAAPRAQHGPDRACTILMMQEAPGSDDEEEDIPEGQDAPALGMIVHLEDGPVCAGFDTWAETSAIRRSAVKASWERAKTKKKPFKGVGGSRVLGEMVKVPVQFRMGGNVCIIPCRVMEDEDMPEGLTILNGTRTQSRIRAVMNADDERVELREIGVVADLEPVEVLTARLQSDALRVLDLCGGMSAAYTTVVDMGFRVNFWHAVENDPDARRVAEALVPGLKHVGEDVCVFRPAEGLYNLVLAGPPCQPWSKANREGLGFGDERSEPFEACCEIIQQVMYHDRVKRACEAYAREKGCKRASADELEAQMLEDGGLGKWQQPDGVAYFMENVVIREGLKHEEERQEVLLGDVFHEVNTMHLGAPQSRTRRVATNVHDMGTARFRAPVDPNVLLEPLGLGMDERVCPCVMASGNRTYTPMRLWDIRDGQHRRRVPESVSPVDAMEVMQGYQTGVTTAWGNVQVSAEARERLAGNAFQASLLQQALRTWTPSESSLTPREARAMYVGGSAAGMQTPLEVMVEQMTEDELAAWMQRRLEGYEAPKLNLTLKKAETAPFQVPPGQRYATPQKLHAAALAGIKKKLGAGSLKLKKYDYRQWISALFVKPKGRVDPDTGEEALRFLTDLRALNNALEWSAHWVEWSPTLENMRESVPKWAKWFFGEDVADAFEHVLLEPGDERLLTVAPPIKLTPDMFSDGELKGWGYTKEEIAELRACTDLLLQWQHCPQGLAPIAPFWNVYLAHGFNALFGEEWHKWWALFVDDMLGYAGEKKWAEVRQRMLSAALRALKLKASPKLDRTIREYGDLTGMRFEEGGVVIADEAVSALVAAMEEPVKNEKGARRLSGIITYAQSAFRWDQDNQTVYADLMAEVHAGTKGGYKWTDRQREAVKALIARVKVAPRIPCKVEDLLADGWVICVKADASKKGIGACLLLVKVGDAREITEEILADPERVRLVGTYSKVLSSDELKWLTFETEAYATYKALRKWGNFIMRVAIQYPDRWVTGMFLDSTTALSKWLSVDVPTHIDHCCAKEMRFRAWADKVAFVRYMNIYMAWWPGGVNDWADLLSRIADKLARCAEERAAQEREGIMMPMHRHSYHPVGESVHSPSTGLPVGYTANHLNVEAPENEKWEEIRRAQLADKTVLAGVTVADVAAVVLNGGVDMEAGRRQNIMPWVGKRFFAVTPPSSTCSVVYTPRSQLRSHDTEEDPVRDLVLLVPTGAMVRITTNAEMQGAAGRTESGHEWATVDLKRDLMLFSHDNRAHPRIQGTLEMLRLLCWFPAVLSEVSSHIDACAHCIGKATSEAAVGVGIQSLRRGSVTQADHRVLTNKEKEAIQGEYTAVLTIVDIATRWVLYVPVRGQSALETAIVILTRWVPIWGMMDLLITDPHSGFASEVMREILRIAGIKGDAKAQGDKGGVAVVERKHVILNRILTDGFLSGQIDCPRKFELAVAFAQVEEDQFRKSGQASHFELWTGQEARTVERLLMTDGKPVVLPAGVSHEDEAVIEFIAEQCGTLVYMANQRRDEKSRQNAMKRDKQYGVSALATRFDLREGDSASFNGNPVKVEELEKVADGEAVTAWVRLLTGGDRFRVRYQALRPLASPMPVKSVILRRPRVGEFVLGHDSEGLLEGGQVATVTEGGPRGVVLSIAMLEGSDSGLSWLPVWAKGTHFMRRKTPPEGYERLRKDMRGEDVCMVGEITPTYRVTESTRLKMEALMII